MVGTELIERGAQPAPATQQASLPEVVMRFSFVLDAAEGRESGHAAKLTYVATLLVARLEVPADVRIPSSTHRSCTTSVFLLPRPAWPG